MEVYAMRKIKLDYWTFYHFCEEKRNFYYDSSRRTLTKKNGEKIRGTLYTLEKPLTDDDKRFLTSWKNVDLFISQCQYAPELKHNAVFIADKCIRA